MNYSNAEIRAMLKELGKVRRDIGRKELKRRQAKQVLNAIGFFLFTGAVVVVLLSL